MEPSSSTLESDLTTSQTDADAPSDSTGEPSFFVEALYAFNGADTASLSFSKGDIIEVLTQLSSGWWDGVVWRQRERGWFPSNYVRRITDKEAELARAQLDLALNQIDPPDEFSSNNVLTHHASSSNSFRLSTVSSIWDGHGQMHGTEPSSDHQDPNSHRLSGSSNTIIETVTGFQTSSQSEPQQRPSNWVGWLPRVTPDGQINYYNSLTGEMASEMPSADDSLEVEDCSPPPAQLRMNQIKPAPGPTDPQSLLSDSLAFLEDHGFGHEQLLRHGIIPPNHSHPQDSFQLRGRIPPSGYSNAATGHLSRLSTSTLTTTSLLVNSPTAQNMSLGTLIHPIDSDKGTESAALLQSPSSGAPNADLTNGLTNTIPSDTSGFGSVLLKQEEVSSVQPALHSVGRSSRLSGSISITSLDQPTGDVFSISDKIKGRLRKSLAASPTPTLAQLRLDVRGAIDALADVTAPYPDSFLLNLVRPEVKHVPLTEEALVELQDRLSAGSLDLGTKIRAMLQAGCQLDTAVLSVLRDPFASAGFASLLPSLIPSTSTPPSPYPSQTESSTSIIPHHNRPASPSTSFSTGPSPIYPELKPVTRKIASTLSKLTLSTRALWGLLSTPISDPSFSIDSTSLEVFPTSELADPTQSEAHHRLTLHARYTLEQKLRSECKMGVSDLSSNVDLFFNHLELLLSESKSSVIPNQSSNASVQSYRAPRHTVGHMSMPFESLFLPGGAKGGNWKASGFTVPIAVTRPSSTLPPERVSEHFTTIVNQPNIRLTSEWFAQQLSPMIHEAREISKVISDLLPSDNQPQDDPLGSIRTSSTVIKRLSHGDEQEWLDTVYSHVFELMDSIGSLLSTLEAIDLSVSLDMDLDQFLWLDGQRKLVKKRASGTLSSDHLMGTLNRLHSSRHLVNEFQKTKQAVYDLVADLARASHELITFRDLCSSVPALSPAQPPHASPLFAIYAPNPKEPPVPSLSMLLHQLTTCLEGFNTIIQSLATEADEQSKLGTDFANNKLVKQALTSNPALRRISSQSGSTSRFATTEGRKSSRRSNSLHGVARPNSGITSGSTPPTSPRLHRLSKGIEEEQAEHEPSPDNLMREPSTDSLPSNISIQRLSLHPPSFVSSSGSIETVDRTSLDSTKRTSVAAASVWSYRTSSSAKSETKVEQATDSKTSAQTTEIPTLPLDGDRPESGSSWSPTRSRKLAKFFGEDTAGLNPVASKATSGKPAFLLPDYGPEDISFNVDNQVRGGSLKGLVIKLTSHEGPDVPFLRVFLMTYRTFTTSHDFLDLLFERYHQQPPPDLTADELKTWSHQKQKVIKIRVINVIRTWIESHLSDEDADSILQRVTDFAARDMGDSSLSKQITLTCERRQSRGHSSKMIPVNPTGNPPPTIVPRNTRKLKFLDIDPLELARQLSLVESKLFCQIQVNECLGKAWPKEFAKEGTPHIKAMIDMSNALTRWVAETILCQPEQKKRANTIKHFILIAERCRALNNFSTLMQIIAGLNSTPIYRLRRTWETIPHKTLALFGQLGGVMSPTKNYATYRDTIRNMAPPCVPFVGVYLTDWTFIGDGNPDMLREKPHQINFNKRQKAAELIVQIQSYQSMPYQLTPVPVIVKFLEDNLDNPRDEKELYDMSLDIEPRERDDEKIARLLAEPWSTSLLFCILVLHLFGWPARP
ncbi:hypothetical protein CROQUDRAFT_718845 [Cronartium quercuum f. sp. fusiforme G11]|uniref:Cell division control protein 25 n=1 Tax=Cronartium quercuum f. sp. fusiforme G11 TaxID=708437 RepID=A0A9P6T5J0_9BASI|nr:hypothetical protein CROQUDRAFT_718845 [Cronartium quercuum f. sp. fusiforme G11]